MDTAAERKEAAAEAREEKKEKAKEREEEKAVGKVVAADNRGVIYLDNGRRFKEDASGKLSALPPVPGTDAAAEAAAEAESKAKGGE